MPRPLQSVTPDGTRSRMLSTPAVSVCTTSQPRHPRHHLGDGGPDLVGRHVERDVADAVGHVLGGIDHLVAQAGRRIIEDVGLERQPDQRQSRLASLRPGPTGSLRPVEVVEERYDAADRERIVPEPPKRVDAPERKPFERDRARVVHAASFRRLAAKTQVVGPQSDDFVRNRLTHSLEVAQIARDLSRALGTHPDIAETAALAHDLGHPPFGHNGERALNRLAAACGGFEGNAQTLRLLTRLEAKTVGRLRHLGRTQPDPGHARRLHEVPVDASRGSAARRACTATA